MLLITNNMNIKNAIQLRKATMYMQISYEYCGRRACFGQSDPQITSSQDIKHKESQVEEARCETLKNGSKASLKF